MRFNGALLALGMIALSACQTTTAQQTPAAQPPSGAQSQAVYQMFAQGSGAPVVDGRVFLAPAPVPNDPVDAADQVIARGPWSAERIEQARQDNAIDPFAAFDSVLGAEFRADRLPATRTLLMRVARDAGMASQAPKALYHRPRPFVRNPSQSTCVTTDDLIRDSGSYPSGHAALGFAWGLVLAELEPTHADALIKRGYEFSESRVVCGVHFESDIAAGRVLGAAVVARLHADTSFQEQVAAARAELAAH